jgi:hypothetical protein
MRLVVSGSQHRAKAANAGLEAAHGTFVHFLDDDDSIEPAFYKKTLAFLAAQPRFGAVATLADRVVERILPDGSLLEVSRTPHYPETRAISLATFAAGQTFAPVAFVARRHCIEAVGPFDVSLEVCEDYEFYLRFLARFDIGILPEALCSFHQRENTNLEAWGNSPASSQHRVEDALFRNALLRRDLEQGRIGLGWLLAFGELSRADRQVSMLFDSLRRRSFFRFLLECLRVAK